MTLKIKINRPSWLPEMVGFQDSLPGGKSDSPDYFLYVRRAKSDWFCYVDFWNSKTEPDMSGWAAINGLAQENQSKQTAELFGGTKTQDVYVFKSAENACLFATGVWFLVKEFRERGCGMRPIHSTSAVDDCQEQARMAVRTARYLIAAT